ncbi:PREDICTED: mannosyl-oligosaccharide 1,2-alpha-mannosidase IC-like [Mandrillus leucophaeus]|uniref:mannosyl-oligosaccharide 1,2-alpha-mannosidase IC-like n=1 Tax=Mandrillus leucophaeus TaxID=9568 RepID=UPI0005F514BC|nr:PREDICTED: mannosyl-oligosaccharide 1,2-alpha-mannosidase IC-like [Mandrillus leucophaeus]
MAKPQLTAASAAGLGTREATAARGNSIPASRPGDEGVSFRFDFNAFRSRLRHPVLGMRADESQEPQSRVRAQREKVKEMMQFAWQSYKRYAMGKNELRPLTKDGYEGNMFGGLSGATVIDSLDTLYLMELKEEFQEAKAWVEESFHLNVSGEASLFEVNIRYIGGLLSAFYLTGEEVFRIKAIRLGEKLLPAFNTPTGIPKGVVSFKSGSWGWATAGSSSILAEFGSLHLEFLHLTELSGNQVFAEKASLLPSPSQTAPTFFLPSRGMSVQLPRGFQRRMCPPSWISRRAVGSPGAQATAKIANSIYLCPNARWQGRPHGKLRAPVSPDSCP